jgi:hypothetical protein
VGDAKEMVGEDDDLDRLCWVVEIDVAMRLGIFVRTGRASKQVARA